MCSHLHLDSACRDSKHGINKKTILYYNVDYRIFVVTLQKYGNLSTICRFEIQENSRISISNVTIGYHVLRDDIFGDFKTQRLNCMSSILGIEPVKTFEEKFHVLHGTVEIARVVINTLGKSLHLSAVPMFVWQESSYNDHESSDSSNSSNYLPDDQFFTAVIHRLSDD